MSPQDPQPGNRFVSFVRASEARRGEAAWARCPPGARARRGSVCRAGPNRTEPWRIRAGVVPGLSRVVPGCPACVKTREIDFDCSPGEQLKPIFRVLTQTSLIREFRNRAGVVPGLSRGCPVVVPGLSCESYVSPVNPVNPVNTVNPL